MRKKRVRLSPAQATLLGLRVKERIDPERNPRYGLTPEQLDILDSIGKPLENNSDTKSNTYGQGFVLSAWTEDGRVMNIDEYCQYHGLPRDDVHSSKLVSHTGTPYYNIVFKENIGEILGDIDTEFIEEVFKKYIKTKRKPFKPIKTDGVDRVVYSDVHIGMDTNKGGFAMYPEDWSEKAIMKDCNSMIDYIISNKKNNVLYIDDLGDFLDGWDGKTTRNSHELPQQMDNQQMFDVGFRFKVTLVDELSKHYDSIICNNICEDNHSGSFGYIVNQAVKYYVELKHNNVQYNNLRQFMNEYYIKDYCVVLTHGKDSKSLKFGFKPFLEARQLEKIDQYLKQKGIYKRAKYIEFSKGDSHQALFDMCTSDDFDYFNYPAFSPSSEWVQNNFKKGRRGFVMQHINLTDGNKIIVPVLKR